MEKNINSNIQPTIIDNLIFTISNEGYLTIIDSKDRNIIKVKTILFNLKKKKEIKLILVGFFSC